jgi:hypothetical protein
MSFYTSTFSSAKRIPTTTFDSILPAAKMSTWEQEDAATKKKRSSAELAAAAKARVGNTMKSAMSKAETLKKAVERTKEKRDTDKQIRKAEKQCKAGGR